MIKEAEKQRVAVIGGGLAGLSAALYLAKHGLYVTLFERSSNPGGRAQTTVKDGYYMNFGPHAHYLGGAGRPFLQELGIEPTGNPPPTGRSLAFFKGRNPILPLSIGTILQTTLFGPIDKVRLLRFMSRLNFIKPDEVESLTVNKWIDSDKDLRNGGEALKGLIRTLAQLTTYTGDTGKLSARAALIQLQLAVQSGVTYLHGGWAQMVDALLEKSREAGVEIVSGCEVTEISRNTADRNLSVVYKDREKVSLTKSFDAIILAVPPNVVKRIVSAENLSAGKSQLILGGAELTDVKAACLDVCLTELPRPENTYALGIDEPLYYSVHSASANLTPPNGALVHLAYYLKTGETGTDQIEKRLEKMLDTLQPGWTEKLVYKRFLANIVVTHKLLSVENGKLSGYWTEETNEADVYRAGDWVGAHQLADASLGSAKRASEMIISHLQQRPLRAVSFATVCSE